MPSYAFLKRASALLLFSLLFSSRILAAQAPSDCPSLARALVRLSKQDREAIKFAAEVMKVNPKENIDPQAPPWSFEIQVKRIEESRGAPLTYENQIPLYEVIQNSNGNVSLTQFAFDFAKEHYGNPDMIKAAKELQDKMANEISHLRGTERSNAARSKSFHLAYAHQFYREMVEEMEAGSSRLSEDAFLKDRRAHRNVDTDLRLHIYSLAKKINETPPAKRKTETFQRNLKYLHEFKGIYVKFIKERGHPFTPRTDVPLIPLLEF